MKMSMFTILLTSVLLSCGKSSMPPATDPDPIVVNPQPVQYGTPFSQVPDPKDAVIYQVNMRAFSSKGDFKGVQARLDSIRALGVNVLYLMPCYPVGILNSVNSPYCIKDYNSVAPEFGNLEDLRTLVAEAHNRNMAVIFDWVANHTAWDHPWITNKSWYQQDASGNIISPANTGWKDVAALNFSNNEMRSEMIKAMKSWIYSVNIDGYRCDAADFVPYNFWKQAIDSLKNISSHKLLLFAEGTRADHFAAGFQLEYGMGFFYIMKDRIFKNKASVKVIDSLSAAENGNASVQNQIVRYTSNHDIDLTDGPPADLFDGQKGALTAFVVATCLKGVPMIYNGQEISYPVALNYFNNSTPINWVSNPSVTSSYKKVIAFRNGSNALKSGVQTSYSSDDVCAFVRTAGTDKVLVIANLRNQTLNYNIPVSLSGSMWKNTGDDSMITLNSQLQLQPYSYMILINK